MGLEVTHVVTYDIFTNKVPPQQILFMGYSMRLSVSESRECQCHRWIGKNQEVVTCNHAYFLQLPVATEDNNENSGEDSAVSQIRFKSDTMWIEV
jgi:hypothetical protein